VIKIIETNPITKTAVGAVKILIKAGTNWKAGNIEDKKEAIVSGPQYKSKNNIKMKREITMRILTGFNLPYLYIE
jgi:hypothetical protein